MGLALPRRAARVMVPKSILFCYFLEIFYGCLGGLVVIVLADHPRSGFPAPQSSPVPPPFCFLLLNL